MKLVTYLHGVDWYDPRAEMYSQRRADGRGGVLVRDKIFDLNTVVNWGREMKGLEITQSPTTLLDFVNMPTEERQALCQLTTAEIGQTNLRNYPLSEVILRAPLEIPPSVRDFYAFEQHVKTARSNRGLGMIPEWYQFPVFYFSNHRAVYGPDDLVPYPRQSQALDFELEMACVIGRAGRDIKAADAADYIAGYMVMNDWSARDLQMQEMVLNMGPVKGKDFATSLGPCLVTPDELADKRTVTGAEERYDLTMSAKLNGKEISTGNFKDIYFSFPQMVERASLNTWLVPGDVLGSGTVGTGCLLEQGDSRERYLQPDDVLELEIERLGLLSNRVVAAE